MNEHITKLLVLLDHNNYPVLLLSWPLGSKGTNRKWKHLTPASMTPSYLGRLAGKNIGVALGEKSSGLCSIDIDADGFIPAFDAANPALKNTLRSRGSRGCNVWVRFKGNYPGSTKPLKTHSGESWGEFRTTGGQTIISGKHPSGCDYQHNGNKVLLTEFEDISWPTVIADPPTLKTPALLNCTEEPEDTEETEEPEGTDETEELKSSALSLSQELFFTVHSVEDALRVSIPDSPHQNNHHLFVLARAVKALEIQQGAFSNDKRLSVFAQWYERASVANVLKDGQTEEDYMMEFLNAYRKAKYPLGSIVIGRAWKRARESAPPPEALRFKNPQTRLLVALCRELQAEAGEEPFYLSSRIAQRLLGHATHSTAATWLGAMVALAILEIAKEGTSKSATRYFYRGQQ